MPPPPSPPPSPDNVAVPLVATPGRGGAHLAAMNAPRIIVNTVSCTGRENFFLPGVRGETAEE
ncbi:hypothetical protein EYF80_045583 [Liparis tanakae]|uniref:Uncharacterized protein n=1 Tax=Liparis tanakae TaxID=230148 RepID=A0A4Z2FSS0_9TELE|nr:hypothetical protein EYF80_045583 [Liparis tanakae]